MKGTALSGYSLTRHHVLINILDNVRNRIEVATPGPEGWTTSPLQGIDPAGFQTLKANAVDPDGDDRFFLTTTDYLTPSTLALASVGEDPVVLKRAPGKFDAAGLSVAQHWTESADGTRIPYFQVSRDDTNEPRPTLLYGYGGFRVPLVPGYSAGTGAAWLERGGVYVVANIRGGGEFGPEWHQAALKADRPRAYEDFIAVAEDLIRRGVTTPERLGAMGGSNGGLLVGNVLTMRPDLFGAIVAQVPLFDMRRYHELLAGASWMAEYGDPDNPGEWAFIEGFSPYHNLSRGRELPQAPRHDLHPGRSRSPGTRPEDGCEDAGHGPRRPLLRERGRRARGRGGQRPAGLHVDAGLSVSMGSARPRSMTAPRARGRIVRARPFAGYRDQRRSSTVTCNALARAAKVLAEPVRLPVSIWER